MPHDTPGAHPFFYIHCEMQDVANAADPDDARINSSPCAAAVELARILHRFELEIGDEDRARMIEIGGFLVRLDREQRELEVCHAG